MQKQMSNQTLKDIQTLADFLGPRDFGQLTRQSLQEDTGLAQADIFVLFGGSILEGIYVLNQAMENKLAKVFIIVGGAGHTTEVLRKQARRAYPALTFDPEISEARLFETILESQFGKHATFLEECSTNCGNNISNLFELLEEKQISWQSMILCQDATMQWRMSATLEKQMLDVLEQDPFSSLSGGPESYPKTILNYAAYKVSPVIVHNQVDFESLPLGMWSFERYLSLLLGEIPRLQDNAQGYGPEGAGYIAHVSLDPLVLEAFSRLAVQFPELIRKADPTFATSLVAAS